ncbi:MAG: glycosyltransferase family 4 protein [Actinomycetota bacterium]
MRVLHVLHTSLPFICGYSIRSDYILRYQREQGMEPAAVTSSQHPNGDAPWETVNGLIHWRTPATKAKLFPGAREWMLTAVLRRKLETAIKEWRPHVIHAHSPMLVGLPALAAARAHGLPLVYEVRDLWENASVDRGKFSENSPHYQVARRLESRVLSRADAVVTICEKLRDAIADRASKPERVSVVGNGVDTASFQPTEPDPAERRRWGLDGKRVIGYVGTFQPYEGLETLIAALPHILRRQSSAHLLITGSGGEEARLRARVREQALEQHVTFTGRLPHAEVKSIYALADLLVYPRLLTRTTALTTPLKPLEAMAMGKPVVVSDVPAMHELVTRGETGLIFRSGDEADLGQRCAEALGSPQQCAYLGENARKWVLAERQWPSLVARYAQVYASVLS